MTAWDEMILKLAPQYKRRVFYNDTDRLTEIVMAADRVIQTAKQMEIHMRHRLPVEEAHKSLQASLNALGEAGKAFPRVEELLPKGNRGARLPDAGRKRQATDK